MGTVTVAEDAVSGQGHAFRDPAGNVVYASGNPCFVVSACPGPDGVRRRGPRWAQRSLPQRRGSSGSPYSGDELAAPDDDRYTPNLVLGPSWPTTACCCGRTP